MNNVLLINRIKPNSEDTTKINVTFVVEGMHDDEICDKIIQTIDQCGFILLEDLIIKYNGINLNLAISNIPKVMRLLAMEGFNVFGVYSLYDN